MLDMQNKAYLATVSDDVVMTREEFVKLLKRFRHHRNVRFGFSRKHTVDIEEYRRKVAGVDSTIPSNVYDLPVVYNTETTYMA